MAEVVAEGEVVLRARENVRAELAKAEAAFERTMAKLDGQEAELKIQADMLDFDRKSKEAKARLEELDKKKATVTIDADTKKVDEAIAKEQANLKKLELANQRLNNRQRKLTEERIAANDRLYEQMEKGEKHVADVADRESKRAADAHKKSQDEITKKQQAATRARITSTIQEQQARERAEAAATRIADREAKARQRVADREAVAAARAMEREHNVREKISGQSARLERQYIDLIQRRSRLQGAKGKVFMPQSERIKVDFDIAGVNEQIAEVEAKLAMIGKPPPEVKIHIEADERGADSLHRWISAISSTTVRLGPFTTTIAGAGRALALLGPIITGIVGSLGALAGAVGSAAIGFGGALTAGVGAFGLVLGSTAGLLPGLLRDFKNLNTLQDAYHKQVLKTGEGSDKAKTKLQEFNHALGEVSPSARQAFDSFDKLQTSYRELSQRARTPFLSAMNEGFKTANTLLGRFGPEALQSFDLVSRGVKAVARALRGPEATGIIGTLFDSGQKALPAFGRGLANLAISAARVGAAFSRMLAPLGSGFETWTKRFTAFTKDSSKMNRLVDGTVKSMRSLGHLAQSTGSFLTTFFGAGVGPGVQLMGKMADGIDRITASIRRNPQGLGNFFGESVDTAERLYGVLAPLASLFMEWATILRPFSNLILSVTGTIGDLVASLAGFGPTRGLIQAAFAVFLAGTLVSKIRNVTGAITALSASLGTLGAKQTALRASSALTGGALAPLGRNAAQAARGLTTAEAAGAVAASRTAAIPRTPPRTSPTLGPIVPAGVAASTERTAASTVKLAGAATRGAKAVGALRVGLTGVGAVLGVANPVFGAAALAVTGAAVAYMYFKHRNDDLKAAVKDTAAATQRTATAYRANTGALADTASAAERANLVVRQARRDLASAKKGTDEYRLAELNLKDALRARVQQNQAVTANQKESVRLSKEQVQRSENELKAFDKLNTSKIKLDQDYIKREKQLYGELSQTGKAREQELNKLLDRRTQLLAQHEAALNRNAAASANNARGMAGLIAATGQAEQQLGQFARAADKASAKKIAVKFQDPGQAGKVAAAATKAIQGGVPKSVATRVAVSTSDAEQSIRRLNAARLTPKKLTIVEQGGKEAVAIVQRLTGLKLTKKEQSIITKGGNEALGLLSSLLGFKLPGKTQALQEKGGAQVLSMLASIAGRKIPDKTMSAILRDLASGKISSIIGLINSIPASRTSTITTVHNEIYNTIRRSGGSPQAAKNAASGHAIGGIWPFVSGGSRRLAGGSYHSPALERTIGRALAATSRVSPQIARGGVYAKPKLLVGEQAGHPEYVIATNPAFRNRNVDLLKSAADRFGMNLVQSAARGKGAPKKKKNPAATPRQLKNARSQAAKRLPKKTTYASDDIEQLPLVETAKQNEADQIRNISIAESQLKEPDTFLKQVGTDPFTGDPIFAEDSKAINDWASSLFNISSMYTTLITRIQEVTAAVTNALRAVHSKMASAQTNMNTIQGKDGKGGLIGREQKILDSNKTSNAEKGAARARIAVYKAQLQSEKQALSDAKVDEKALNEEQHDEPFRIREAGVSRDEYYGDAGAVQGRADTELSGTQPKPGPTYVDPSELALSQAGAQLSEATAKGDITGQIAAQNAIIAANTTKIQNAQALLRDADPTNDIEAYNTIAGGYDAIGSAQDAIKNINGSQLSGILAQGTERSNLFSGFGANYATIKGAMAAGSAFGTTVATGGLSGGKAIQITQNFPTQPDPMTWAASTLYELNSGL